MTTPLARLRVSERADPWLAGAAATLVTALLSWRPSFWFDEAATIAAANRSEVDILRLLLNFDAVHGLYYLAMHVWFSWVPVNEFTARLPSAVAVGAAAAGLLVLGTLLAGRPTGWAAAVAATAVPRTLWAGVEARSYALTAAIAVWLTVALVVAASARGAALWVLYGLVLALAIVSFVYLGLMVFAHALTLALRRPRRTLLPWAAATAGGLALASPLISLTLNQRQQLDWINPAQGGFATGVLFEQWFTRSRFFLGVCVALLACGSAAVLIRRAHGAHAALAVAVPWVVVPTVLLVGYSAWFRDVYQPRYLTFTTPGLGLVLGVCVVAIARHWIRLVVLLLAVLAASSSTAFITQRGRYGKPGAADYSAVADLIEHGARPHDCVVFGAAPREPLRAIAAARPGAFVPLDDVAAGVSGAEAAQLWSQDLPLDSDTVRPRLAACATLWVIVDRRVPSPVTSAAERQGFAVDQHWVLRRTVVLRMVPR
ncbi:glycosyltransferase family 39 protein [Mycobacterium botniense]|nr:mannosyltransferase [Mycobacterium botniense]